VRFIVPQPQRRPEEIAMRRSGDTSTLSRRHFILTTASAAGGLMIGITAAPDSAQAATISEKPWDDNEYAPHEIDAWIAIDPDDSILIRYQRSEMGQGAAPERQYVMPLHRQQNSLGLNYPQVCCISVSEERDLLAEFTRLDFAPFQFHGWLGKRQVVSFGWRYDYNEARFSMAAPIPDFLLPVRVRAARFADLQLEALEQALIS
jgi:hypothetical protein